MALRDSSKGMPMAEPHNLLQNIILVKNQIKRISNLKLNIPK